MAQRIITTGSIRAFPKGEIKRYTEASASKDLTNEEFDAVVESNKIYSKPISEDTVEIAKHHYNSGQMP